ncbi:MAG: proline racemase family protein [Pseudomonadota bacterium]
MLRIIDSHTEGEPTRVIVDGGPPLTAATIAAQREEFAQDFDHYRRRALLEPRGFDAMVGALLREPTRDDCAAAVIFFNNVGYLNMCGHGAIGVAATLYHLGRVLPGAIRLETPVGVVSVTLHDANHATIRNVPSYRYRDNVSVEVTGLGTVTGDIAWGGNWFFLSSEPPCEIALSNEPELTRAAQAIKRALQLQGITGAEGAEIDHVEFFAPGASANAHSRNFVLCPGGAYDRSPCGTGLSAKLACLAAEDELAPGELWIQESMIGSRFTASYSLDEEGRVIPSISGRAFVSAEATLFASVDDPFANGITAA